MQHSDFIAIMGRPNVGKSTLMNAMVGEKVAIFSNRPQTTLNRRTDYVALAEAFGAKGIRLTELSQLEGVLDEALRESGPVLVDARIDPDERVLPMIPPGGGIDDIILS